VKATDPSIKRVDELLVWATVACQADELGGMPDFALGRWARHLEAEAGDRLGRSIGLRSSSKRLQRSPTAACSCSQLGSRRMCWPDFCATNSLVRKISAFLCQIQRLLAADRGWGGTNADREAEGRAEFLPNSWLFEVGVDQYHRALRARALSLTTHRDPRRGLGRA